jgi:glycosyltransferase involved in cell wall biosynthesis
LHLHLLGDGDQSTLQQIANAAGFGDRLHFAVVDDVRPYLSAADAYASTSVTESFGLANFEALFAGLPCICTAVGGVPEVMGQGAWLIPVDQFALECALEELMRKPEVRQMLSARAAVQAKRAPNLQRVVDLYVEIFR